MYKSQSIPWFIKLMFVVFFSVKGAVFIFRNLRKYGITDAAGITNDGAVCRRRRRLVFARKIHMQSTLSSNQTLFHGISFREWVDRWTINDERSYYSITLIALLK